MSAGSLLGGWLDGAYDETPAVTPYQVDTSLYDTGGYGSISDAAKQRAEAAQNRSAAPTNWAMSDADRALALDARDRQMGLADDLEAFLRGEKSSLAQQQLNNGMQRINAEQTNAAANVRGGAGNQLLAAEEARRAALASQLELNAQKGELRSQEEATARAQLGNILGQARGQDLTMRGQSQEQAQFTTQAEMEQRGMNDRMTQFYESLRMQAEQGTSQAKQAQAAAQQAAGGQAMGFNVQIAQDNQQAQRDLVAGASSGGAALTSYGMGNGNAWGQPEKPQPVTDDDWNTAWQQSGGKKWW